MESPVAKFPGSEAYRRGTGRAGSEGEPVGWGAALWLLFFFQAAIVSNQCVLESLVESTQGGSPWFVLGTLGPSL